MKETELPISIMKISDGFHLVVNVLIDGSKARMVLDTAASSTIFDKKRINKLCKGLLITNQTEKANTAAGEIEQSSTQIKKMQFNELTIENYTCVLMDLKELNNTYKKHKLQPIDGILGSDILVKHKAVIDLEQNELYLLL